MAICKNCKEEIQDGIMACPNCGEQQEEIIEKEPEIIEPEVVDETTQEQPVAQEETAPEQPIVQDEAVEEQPIAQEETVLEQPTFNKEGEGKKIDVEMIIDKFSNTQDSTDDFDEEDISNNKLLAVLAYFGILVFITILVAPNSKYARFHASQGINLLVCSVAYFIIYSVITAICVAISFTLGQIVSSVLLLINIFFLALFIIGIINAVQGKAKELPFIGGFKILK